MSKTKRIKALSVDKHLKLLKMSYYMTNIVITPTLYEEKRLEAISYFNR